MSPTASPQPRKSSDADASATLSETLGNIIRKANFYLRTDLDRISQDTIAEDISYLERISEHLSKVKKDLPLDIRIAFTADFRRIKGFARQIVAHLYVARGYATKNIPRHYEYYNHIGETRQLWEEIKGIIEKFHQ